MRWRAVVAVPDEVIVLVSKSRKERQDQGYEASFR